jgi:GAF domain-containing protein
MNSAPTEYWYSHLVAKWQLVINLLAQIAQVPAALIMHVDGPVIEVLVSSGSAGNPYQAGANEHWEDSGLYCEHVIHTREHLLVPNALSDPAWHDNPDVEHHMISYLGFPLLLPDGRAFGTICILDSKENSYNVSISSLMEQFKSLVEADFQLVAERDALEEAMEEIKKLQSLLPICAKCKKIRDDAGLWKQIEEYLFVHHKFTFTHSLCIECASKMYPDLDLDNPADETGLV